MRVTIINTKTDTTETIQVSKEKRREMRTKGTWVKVPDTNRTYTCAT